MTEATATAVPEKPGKGFSTREIVMIGAFAALMAVCSWISIPAPAPLAPFTLQTFAVFCALEMLGGKHGLFAILSYVLIGLVGVPVFAQFTGGPAVLFGSTGGYIIGFIFSALVYWALERVHGGKLWGRILALVLGLAVCYAFGTAWFMVVYARDNGAVGLMTALGWCVIPFIIPDLVKMALAMGISARLRRYVKH